MGEGTQTGPPRGGTGQEWYYKVHMLATCIAEKSCADHKDVDCGILVLLGLEGRVLTGSLFGFYPLYIEFHYQLHRVCNA